MSVIQKSFGKTKDGREASLFAIENANGMKVEVTNFGINIVKVIVPDKNGKLDDIALGYDTIEGYYENDNCFGATIGPNANRIANASFTIDGEKYQLAVNDGVNNLHSDGNLGYHKQLWDAKIANDNSVIFALKETDGSMGFPGNKEITVTVSLTDENELKLMYHATSDKNTLINMTNHSYFNLAGHGAEPILNHKLCIMASQYTPVVSGAIPTGEIASVKGTPFDFTKMLAVGAHIEDDNEQLRIGKGYDHNWVVDDFDGNIRKVAEVMEETSGRTMEVYTNQPGIQFYAGNCIGEHIGKAGVTYGKRSGLALETQVFPNSINQENFPNAVYGPGKDYDATTIYKFSW